MIQYAQSFQRHVRSFPILVLSYVPSLLLYPTVQQLVVLAAVCCGCRRKSFGTVLGAVQEELIEHPLPKLLTSLEIR